MPIEREPPELWIRPGPVEVYREDLDEIDRVLRNVDGAEVRLTARTEEGTYALSGPEGFTELPGSDVLQEVNWSGWAGRNRFHVNVSRRSVFVTGQGLRGPLEEVGDILRRRPRRVAGFFKRTVAPSLLSGTLGAASFAGLWFGIASGSDLVKAIGVVTLVLLVLLWGYMFSWLPRHHAVILRVPRRERPSFWERKRDDVVLAVLGGAVGAVLGGVMGYVVGRL